MKKCKHIIFGIVAAISLQCLSGVTAFAHSDTYTEFIEDFNEYTEESTNYPSDKETYILNSKKSEVIADSGKGYQWITSKVYYANNEEQSNAFLDLKNHRLALEGWGPYRTALLLKMDNHDLFERIDRVKFKTTKNDPGYAEGHGIGLFTDADETNFIYLGVYNGHYEPVVDITTDGLGTPIYAPEETKSKWNACKSYVWDIRINEDLLSWTVTGSSGASWSGMTQIKNQEILKNWEYICSFYMFGDRWKTLDYIEFYQGEDYLDFGEPANVLYVDTAEGQEIKDRVLELNEKDGAVIRRIYLYDFPGEVFGLSEDGVNYDEFTVDENGAWLNTFNTKKYRYVKLPGDPENDVYVYTDKTEKDTIRLDLNQRRSLCAILNGTDVFNEDSNLTWKCVSDNPDIVHIDSYGGIAGVGEGDTRVSIIGSNDRTLSLNVSVHGPYREALEAKEKGDMETWNRYIQTQQDIIAILNQAIADKNLDAVKEFLQNKIQKLDVLKQEKILDQKVSDAIAGLGALELNSLANNLLDFQAFTCRDLDDLRRFGEEIIRECAVVKLSNVGDLAQMTKKLETYHKILGIDLDSEFYAAQSDAVKNSLLKKYFKNYRELIKAFSESVVLENYRNNINPEFLNQLLSEYAEVIGYDQAHYQKISDKRVFAKKLMEQKSSIESVEKIRIFMDQYQETDNSGSGSGSSGGGSGSGSSGGKKSGNSGISISANPIPVNPNPATPAVERVQLFDDVPTDHWAYEQIRNFAAKNYVKGYDGNVFLPGQNITRAEFITILLKAFELMPEKKEEEQETEEKINVFSDNEPGKWYYDNMLDAYAAGVIAGTDGNCDPERDISREEAAAMILRAVNNKKMVLNNKTQIMIFEDDADISDWAKGSVRMLQAAGVLHGDNGCFYPKRNASRAEVVVMLANVLQALEKTEEVTGANE